MATTAVRERTIGRVVAVGARVALGTVLGVVPYVLAIHEVSGEWALSMKPSVGAVGLTQITEETGEVPRTSPHGWPEVVPAPPERSQRWAWAAGAMTPPVLAALLFELQRGAKGAGGTATGSARRS